MKHKFIIAALISAMSLSLCAADAKKAEAPAKPASTTEIKSAPALQKDNNISTQSNVALPKAAEAQQPEAAPKKRGGIPWDIIIMVGVFGLMFYMMYRSNKKQQQKRQEMLDRVVKGAKVMLNSGVYGKIIEVRDEAFVVEIAPNVNVLVVKNGVASVEDSEAEKESKESK